MPSRILTNVAPVKDDFARVAGAHGIEALFVVAPVEAMGDDLRDVEAALEHDCHLVPGLVHLATINAADGQLVEDDLVPIDGDVFRWDAEHGDLCTVAHVGEHLAECVGVAGHFETDVEALVHVELLLDFFEGRGAGIDRLGDADFVRQVAAVLVGVGDDDVTCSGVAGYGCGHDADGARAGDEDIFSENGKGERGVDGIAEGVEDGGDLMGDAGRVTPDVGHGEDDVLGEGAITVDSDSERVGAEVAAAGETVAATSADDVAFAADELADGEIGDIGADGYDFADELVSDHETLTDGGFSPGVPVVDMEIGATDASVKNANLDVVDAHLWLGYVLEPKTALVTVFY
jgi:hypothetical protein